MQNQKTQSSTKDEFKDSLSYFFLNQISSKTIVYHCIHYISQRIHSISLSRVFLTWIQSQFYIVKNSLKKKYTVTKKMIENSLESIDFLLTRFFSKMYFENNQF